VSAEPIDDHRPYMIGTRGRDFRAACGAAMIDDQGDNEVTVTIERQLANVLGIDTGSPVRVAPLRPSTIRPPAGPLEYSPHDLKRSE
jgi:hypothetical protein